MELPRQLDCTYRREPQVFLVNQANQQLVYTLLRDRVLQTEAEVSRHQDFIQRQERQMHSVPEVNHLLDCIPHQEPPALLDLAIALPTNYIHIFVQQVLLAMVLLPIQRSTTIGVVLQQMVVLPQGTLRQNCTHLFVVHPQVEVDLNQHQN
jgi:hypothetical protein